MSASVIQRHRARGPSGTCWKSCRQKTGEELRDSKDDSREHFHVLPVVGKSLEDVHPWLLMREGFVNSTEDAVSRASKSGVFLSDEEWTAGTAALFSPFALIYSQVQSD